MLKQNTKDASGQLLAWHYTTGQNFRLIVVDGFLCPTSVGVVPPERPAVWFSLNQRFEPTALKGTIDQDTGLNRPVSIDEMYEYGGGLVRFGVPPAQLFTGSAMRRRLRMSGKTWRGLAAAGRNVGAYPQQWFATPDPLPVSGLVVDVMNDAGRWERVQQVGEPA